jgi:hypothetical protein
MQRRTFRQLRATSESAHHYSVYVVLLHPNAAKSAKLKKVNPAADPAKPCVYVGMTGLTPAERLRHHRRGEKAAPQVRRHGIRLMPELYEWLNPMPFEAAVQMEQDLAEDLRRQGYMVAGGH